MRKAKSALLATLALMLVGLVPSVGARATHQLKTPALLTYIRFNGRTGLDICLLRLDGTQRFLFGAERWQARAVSWSPSGRYLAFSADTRSVGSSSVHDTDIFIANARGRVTRNLTKRVPEFRAVEIVDPAWSPNGRWIAFAASTNGFYFSYRIWVVHPDGSGLRDLRMLGRDPTWSPDSRRLAFSVNAGDTTNPPGREVPGIYTAALKRPQPKLIAEGGSSPSWSPDGRRIAFPRAGSTDLMTVSPDGSNLRNLTNTPNVWEGEPAWSPGGKLIAFTRAAFTPPTSWVQGLGVMGADGGDERVVRADEAAEPTWRRAAPLPKLKRQRCD